MMTDMYFISLAFYNIIMFLLTIMIGFILALATGAYPGHTHPVPGKKCPACLAKDETVWVIPGKCCPQCGTAIN